MKTLSLSIFLLLISLYSFSQKKKEEEIFTAVEQQAEFIGGMGAFGKYLSKNFRIEKGEECPSNIYIQFVVEKNGTATDIKILKPVSKSMDERLIKLMRIKWKPGRQSGKIVRSRFTIPIHLESCGE
jgi:periplasmic protein TonB